MNSKLKNENTDLFFRAVLSLKDSDECYDFFEDLCTVSELQAMAQRFHVARLLSEGKTYKQDKQMPRIRDGRLQNSSEEVK